jgi:hypothetical protein
MMVRDPNTIIEMRIGSAKRVKKVGKARMDIMIIANTTSDTTIGGTTEATIAAAAVGAGATPEANMGVTTIATSTAGVRRGTISIHHLTAHNPWRPRATTSSANRCSNP